MTFSSVNNTSLAPKLAGFAKDTKSTNESGS